MTAAPQNTFGLKLLADETAHHPRKNVFVSPTSIYLDLAMLENGAAGGTLKAMRQTMAVPSDVTDDALQQFASAFSKALQSRKEVQLAIANAIWSDPVMTFAPAFVEKCRRYYAAEATSFEFSKPGAKDVINSWCARHTQNKITEIVDDDTMKNSIAILTNAIYFKGLWQSPFSKQDTVNAPFQRADGTVRAVKMMSKDALTGAYRSGDSFETAELPYGHSGLSMFAILPKSGISPETAIAKVSTGKPFAPPEPALLNLKLPRFSVDYSTKLKDPLIRMGMGVAFRYPGAEFAPIGSDLFYVGQVLHKTRLEVDEEGTVAAAVTAIVGVPGSAAPRPMPTKTLVFDRPFALLLCDKETQAILFAGVIYDPN